MADEALDIVRLRNEFYRDNYRRVVGALLLAVVIIIILATALGYMVTHPPAPKYFATDPQGRLIELVPLAKPNLSNAALLQWANIASVASFSYNFVNYRQELQAASEFFTTDGWKAFIVALNQSNNLQAITAKKLIVSAVATGAPVVLQQGVIDGVYSWQVEMPMLITYQNPSQFTQQNVVVKMRIIRVSTLVSPKGVGIAQFIVTGGSTIT